jgi:hypothetical protein
MDEGDTDDTECVICHLYCHESAVECDCCPRRRTCLRHAAALCECPPPRWRIAFRHSLAELQALLAEVSQRIPEGVLHEPPHPVPPVSPCTLSTTTSVLPNQSPHLVRAATSCRSSTISVLMHELITCNVGNEHVWISCLLLPDPLLFCSLTCLIKLFRLSCSVKYCTNPFNFLWNFIFQFCVAGRVCCGNGGQGGAAKGGRVHQGRGGPQQEQEPQHL